MMAGRRCLKFTPLILIAQQLVGEGWLVPVLVMRYGWGGTGPAGRGKTGSGTFQRGLLLLLYSS